MVTKRGAAFLGVLGILGLLACGSAASDTDAAVIGVSRSAIVGGSSSDAAQDPTVLLFVLDPNGPRRLGICTATLVAPRLVLTARHCVAVTSEQVACAADGTPLVGARVEENRDPSNIYVFTGKARPEWIGDAPPSLDPSRWAPAGRGLAIIDDGASTLCNHDLAFVLLREPIVDVTVASLRLDANVAAGEKLVTAGWGVTFGEVEPSERQQRGGVTVKRVGPSTSSPVLTEREFLFDESICLGDSGGPVFAEASGAVVGVVSRGGNGLDPNLGGPSSTCEGADNLATTLAPFEALVTEAFSRASASPKREAREESQGGCSIEKTHVHPSGPRAMAGLCLLAVGIRVRRRRERAPSG